MTSHPICLNFGNVVSRSPDAIVYLEYNPRLLPDKPSGNDEKWTRFVCLSDTHSRSFDVPDGDVLLHGGDLTDLGTVKEFEKVTKWLYSLPHGAKIIIAGNHDLTLHEDWYPENFSRFVEEKQDLDRIINMLKGPEAIKANLVYLQNTVHKFKVHENGKEWSVYGSPWSPEFGNWAFNYHREDGEDLVAKFPSTDILLTHAPPYQIFDRTICRSDSGCEALRARLPFLRPRLHVFGHIHEAHGAHIHKWATDVGSGEELPVVQNVAFEPSRNSDMEIQEVRGTTVLVNAANYPMGPLAVRNGVNLKLFGGPGFQPVIVDLRE